MDFGVNDDYFFSFLNNWSVFNWSFFSRSFNDNFFNWSGFFDSNWGFNNLGNGCLSDFLILVLAQSFKRGPACIQSTFFRV